MTHIEANRSSPEGSLPAQIILALVGDKWTTVVLYCLSLREVRRFNELQRQIPEISKKMLVQTLRNLERDGLVARTVYAQVPPKTEYRLTEDGHRLREPIAELCRWAVDNEAFVTTIVARRRAAMLAGDR
jgi:DNA-binding HxlR family transcriptional regulator